jgi:hypothetical protein
VIAEESGQSQRFGMERRSRNYERGYNEGKAEMHSREDVAWHAA